MHQNVQDVRHKVDRIFQLLQDGQHDMAILSEYGLKTEPLENNKTSRIFPQNTLLQEETSKGEVAIYVRDSLQQKPETRKVFQNCKQLVRKVKLVGVTVGRQHLISLLHIDLQVKS